MNKTKITWFNVMWSNGYLQTFFMCCLFLGAVIIVKDTFESSIWFYVVLAFLICIISSIAYFGFYKFWKEIKDYIE